MQFDAAIDQEEDCADDRGDSSDFSDCTEEVKVCCGWFSCSNRSIFAFVMVSIYRLGQVLFLFSGEID